MDVDAVLHTSAQLSQTLQPLKGASDKTSLLLEDVTALSRILRRVRNTTFDEELLPMYDPMWESLVTADRQISEVVTEFERRVITIRAEMAGHLKAVQDITNLTLDGDDRLDGTETEITTSRLAEAQFDAEVVAWETAPVEQRDQFDIRGIAEGLEAPAEDCSLMSRYFPDRNGSFQLNDPAELDAIRSYFTDPARREAAIVSDSWTPAVSFLLHPSGGSGKSELARHYCHSYGDSYKFIAWINAADASTVLASFKKCISYIKKNHYEYFKKHYPISEAQRYLYDSSLVSSIVIEFVLTWLESLVAPWLMVIDNMGNAAELPPPIHFGSGSMEEGDSHDHGGEASKMYMLLRSLSYLLPRKCGKRIIGHVLVTGKKDMRANWLDVSPCDLYAVGDQAPLLPFSGTLSVQSIEQLFFSYLLENEMDPVISGDKVLVDSGEMSRHRELLESDIIACGMDLVRSLHNNPLAIVQALSAIREVRIAHRLGRHKLQGDATEPHSAHHTSVPRQLAVVSPPVISDYLSWMNAFSESANDSFRDMYDYAACYQTVLTSIAVVIEKLPSIRVWSIKRSLELLSFVSPHSIDFGLLQLFLRPPHTPFHVRLLGKWRVPNMNMTFSVQVRLQEAEFEFEVESVFPLTLLNKTKRFKLRVFRSYAKIREAHDAVSKLYCPAAAKLRFPSAILSIQSDGNAEDAVSVRRAEISTFFKDLSRCPCWGTLCTTAAFHSLFGIVPAPPTELIHKVGSEKLYLSADPLNMLLECTPEFLRLVSPLVSLSLLNVTHSEILVPTEDTKSVEKNPFLSTFGMSDKSAAEKYKRRLECSMNKCTQMALQMWLSIEGRYDAAFDATTSFLHSLLKSARVAIEAPAQKRSSTSTATDPLIPKEATAVCETEYIDNSILSHALFLVLENAGTSDEFIALAEECFRRAVLMPSLYDKAELCCQRCLDIIDSRGASSPDGPGSILEASWYVNYADILYLTSRQDKARGLYEHALKAYRKAPPGKEDVAGVLKILKKLGKVYFEDARYKQAERILEESIELSRVINIYNPEQLAVDLGNYATVMSSAAPDLRTIEQCVTILKEELELLRAVHGEKSVDFSKCANAIGELEKRCGHNSMAREWFETSLDVLVSLGDGTHPDMTAPLYNMALICHSEGDFDRAKKMYEKALDIDALHFGEKHLGAANMHDSLGILLCDQGHYDVGLDHLRIACDLYETFCGGGSRDTILSLNSLGYAYIKMGETSLGINVYEKSLVALRDGDNRSDDDVTAQTLNALGEANAALGRYQEARQLFMECYGLRISVLGDKHPDTANVMRNLSTVAFAMNSYTEAREMALGALKIYRMKYGTGSTHESIIPVLSDLGDIYHKLGKVKEANDYFEEALRARRLTSGQNNEAKLGALLMNYGRSLFGNSSFPDSARKYTEALELLRKFHEPSGGNSVVAQCLFELSAVKRAMGLIDDAQSLMEQCLALRHDLFGEESEPVAEALMQLCEIFRQQKDIDAALDAGEECARIRAQLYGTENSALVASALQVVANLTLLKGKGEEALAIYRDALAITENILAGTKSSDASSSDDALSKQLGKNGALRSVGISMTTIMHQIANILTERDCFVEATALFERCLDMRRRIYGEEHEEVASTLHCIAAISYRRGLFEESLEIHSIGHAIRKQCFGESDVMTAASECYVAISELSLGLAEKARDRLETCVHRLRLRFGDESTYVAITLHYMSQCFLFLKDYDSTVIIEEKALDILLEIEGRESGLVVDSLTCIGDAYRAQNNAAAAKKQYAKALEILKLLDQQSCVSKQSASLSSSTRGIGSYKVGSGTVSRGRCHGSRVRGYTVLILEYCKGGEGVLSASGSFDTREKSVARVMALYERMLWALDTLRSPVEADSFAEEALDLYSATFGINSHQMVPLLRMLGLRQRRKGDYSGALPFLEKTLWIQENSIDTWSDSDTQDEALRLNRSSFLDETILNINDISWLFDKQGMVSDATTIRAKSSRYNDLLKYYRVAGAASVPEVSGHSVSAQTAERDSSSSALLSYATSERQKEIESTTDSAGGAYSLLSNLSLFLSSKSE